MKKILFWVIITILITSFSLMGIGCSKETVAEETAEAEEVAEEEVAEEEVAEEVAAETVTISMTSWRTEDTEQINEVNQLFMEAHPNIIVKYDPIDRNNYESRVLVDLEGGVAADIIAMAGLDRGRQPYDAGYILTLNDWLETDAPEVLALPDAAKVAWLDKTNEQLFALPLFGVCHGIYYNKNIFDENGLNEPETWADFIKICDTLKANGITPIAAGAGHPSFVSEHGGMAYGPNFYGGETARVKLVNGELKFTDEPFIKFLTAIDSLTQYYPKGYMGIDYETSQQLFCSGETALFLGGSWEIGTFASIGYDFELGFFPAPVINKGDKLQFVLHPDIGYGINKNSKNIEAAKEYLKWVAGCEFNQNFANALPGFFPFADCSIDYTDPIAKEYIDVIQDPNTELTIELTSEAISAQEPGARTMMLDVVPKLLNHEWTPQQSAEYVQESVATWYEPWQE